MSTSEEVLRRLSVGDPVLCQALLSARLVDEGLALDARSTAVLRLGASIAAGSMGLVLRQRVSDALDTGIGFDEVVAALVALAPSIGTERLVAIAPQLAAALGYDVDSAFERLDDAGSPTGLHASPGGGRGRA